MIIGVGSIILTFGMLCYDIHKKKTTPQSKTKKPEVIRLCLTGGPCGGKSEGINMLYNSLKNITVPVFIVPEAATIIGSAGLALDLSKFEPREI